MLAATTLYRILQVVDDRPVCTVGVFYDEACARIMAHRANLVRYPKQSWSAGEVESHLKLVFVLRANSGALIDTPLVPDSVASDPFELKLYNIPGVFTVKPTVQLAYV